MNIYKIVLTGGPCAGKTTVLKKIKELLTKENYYVITVPETATYMIQNGTPPLENQDHKLYFQDTIFKTQLFKEKNAKLYCQYTLKTKPSQFENKKGIIILCDRGIMDNRAYLSQKEYNNILDNNNLNELEILYSYDLVINLISLASSDKNLYQLDGIRYETPEMAAKRDNITSSAWLLHPNLKIIKPTDTIEEKINLVYNYILESINNNHTNETIKVNENEINIPLNDDNSKISTKTYYCINYPNNKKYTLIKTTYENHQIYTINNKYITKEEYLNLRNLGLLEKIKEENIINYIHNGNHYQCIKSKSIKNTNNKTLKKARRI